MKTPERLIGYIFHGNNEMAFEFDFTHFILNLYPSKSQYRTLTSSSIHNLQDVLEQFKNNWIPHKILIGKGVDNKKIFFSVESLPSNMNGFLSFNVDWYLYGTHGFDEDSIHSLCLRGNTINVFFPPKDPLELNFHYVSNVAEDFSKIDVSISQPNTISCGSYDISDSISATIEIRSSGYCEPLNYQQFVHANSQVLITFNTPINLETALSEIQDLHRLFVFLTYRSDIRLETINLQSFNNSGKQYHSGDLFFPKKEIPPIDGQPNKRIIEYRFLETHICNLIEAIKLKKAYLDHIPSFDSRNIITPNRVVMIFAAFESVFFSYYGKDAGRSNKYIAIKQEITQYLKALQNTKTSQEKKYVGSLLSLIKNHDSSLGKKIEHALQDCLQVMKPFLEEQYSTSDDMSLCNRLNDLRNKLVHGNLSLEIETTHVSDIHILEILIYAIVLKHTDVSDEDSQKALAQLFNLS
ncbi:MAG: hypothetical protein Q4C56_02780 [Peptococcaceae bacterium]|nr:hypothetical protein [Peptococcaceae bacterium]